MSDKGFSPRCGSEWLPLWPGGLAGLGGVLQLKGRARAAHAFSWGLFKEECVCVPRDKKTERIQTLKITLKHILNLLQLFPRLPHRPLLPPPPHPMTSVLVSLRSWKKSQERRATRAARHAAASRAPEAAVPSHVFTCLCPIQHRVTEPAAEDAEHTQLLCTPELVMSAITGMCSLFRLLNTHTHIPRLLSALPLPYTFPAVVASLRALCPHVHNSPLELSLRRVGASSLAPECCPRGP